MSESSRAGRRGLGLALVLLPALAALGCGRRADAPSVLLITLDTTRARALGCYGNPFGTTPHLDRLAEEGTLYEQARTVAPVTLPAHASMLTGLYPPRHGLRDNGLWALSGAAETVAERAAAAGVQTGAIVAAPVLHRRYGLAQGFDSYSQPSTAGQSGRLEMDYRQADEIADEAIAWWQARAGGPRFLWVHFFDPHEPYRPQPALLERVGGRAYLAEVAAMDAAIGRLLAAMREDGSLDRSTVLVIGDHGEDFQLHGEPTHSVTCYDTTLRVPFLIRRPGAAGAGQRIRAPVSVADAAPTIASALGLAPGVGLDGIDLLAAPPDRRGVYFESYVGYLNYGWSPVSGWLDAEGKYLHSAVPEFFQPLRDADEREDRIADTPAARLEPYREALRLLAAAPALAGVPLGALAAQDEAELRELGYAGVGDPEAELPPPGVAPAGLPSPHRRTEELRAFYEAARIGGQGAHAEAIPRLEAIVAGNPRNLYARELLGLFLYRAGRPADAEAALLPLVEAGHQRPTVLDVLGHCAEELGRRSAARAWFERAAAARPGDAHLAEDLERSR